MIFTWLKKRVLSSLLSGHFFPQTNSDVDQVRQIDQLKWLINRSDQLRLGIGSGAGTLVSVISILITVLGIFLSFVVTQLLPTTKDFIWAMRLFLGSLGIAGVLFVVALLWAVSALAAAHGVFMSRLPKENILNSIGDVTHEMDPDNFSKSLRSHLKTAVHFQREAQSRMKKSLFVLVVALILPFFSLVFGALFLK